MVALYLLCKGRSTQQPNSRSPKDTASYWDRSAVYRSWKDAKPGGGTSRSNESSLDRLRTETIWFNSALCARFSFSTARIWISNMLRPGEQSEQTPDLQQQQPLQTVGHGLQSAVRERLHLQPAAVRQPRPLVQGDKREERPIGRHGGTGELREEVGAYPGPAAEEGVSRRQDGRLQVGQVSEEAASDGRQLDAGFSQESADGLQGGRGPVVRLLSESQLSQLDSLGSSTPEKQVEEVVFVTDEPGSGVRQGGRGLTAASQSLHRHQNPLKFPLKTYPEAEAFVDARDGFQEKPEGCEKREGGARSNRPRAAPPPWAGQTREAGGGFWVLALNLMVGQQGEENLGRQPLQLLKGLHWLETVLRKRVMSFMDSELGKARRVQTGGLVER
ncbi:hypothetical protein EYF80_009605 [Liparis tanakae]|uniref:Uncharacterized protein n=1 Tax=Liparis tanakae TaxID=230148 RepID=A0A4Z2IQK9_9TELE|nr:hypothetical protein EYF80_009605 [Liparis tanakae]